MKKLLILMIALLPIVAYAQEKQSVVTLKNGTELKGVIKAIDPTDALTIVIAGIETKIKMADVAKVEEIANSSVSSDTNEFPKSVLRKGEKIVVTDKADYPESFVLNIGDCEINMILVRGGDMNMGYDGDGSLGMDSEPVHEVGVTSFYMSESYLPYILKKDLFNKKTYTKTAQKYIFETWNSCNEIVNKIAEVTAVPVRLPTEAEWEYAACSDKQSLIFGKCHSEEYCSDNYADFYNCPYTVDPTGPTIENTPNKEISKSHVVREYKKGPNKHKRGKSSLMKHVRIVVKAKDVDGKYK